MCLQLAINQRQPLTAEEDIVVYKRLCSYTRSIRCSDISDPRIKTGASFTATVRGIQLSGEIAVIDDKIYLYQDDINGMCTCNIETPRKYKLRVSSEVRDLVIDGLPVPSTTLVYETPYKEVEVKIGETYTSKLSSYWPDRIEVGLHTYEHAISAITARTDSRDVVAECVIPKGAIYYKGTFLYKSSYASNTLKYIKLLTHDEVVNELSKSYKAAVTETDNNQ